MALLTHTFDWPVYTRSLESQGRLIWTFLSMINSEDMFWNKENYWFNIIQQRLK